MRRHTTNLSMNNLERAGVALDRFMIALGVIAIATLHPVFVAIGAVIIVQAVASIRRQRQRSRAYRDTMWHYAAMTGNPITMLALSEYLDQIPDRDANLIHDWIQDNGQDFHDIVVDFETPAALHGEYADAALTAAQYAPKPVQQMIVAIAPPR